MQLYWLSALHQQLTIVQMLKCSTRIIVMMALACLVTSSALAQEVAPLAVESSGIIRTAVMLTALAIIPALFMTMTSFMRIAIVLSMVRHAFGMPETPPNPVLIALALFLSVFVMGPTLQEINSQALQPYMAGAIDLEDAIDVGQVPIRKFMLAQVREQDLEAMYAMSGQIAPNTADEVGLMILTPAFIINELRIAFTIGFLVLLPFLLIDLVVSSILLSLGMMMVPPSTISLPIKLLMFVVIDGWSLVIEGVLGGFG